MTQHLTFADAKAVLRECLADAQRADQHANTEGKPGTFGAVVALQDALDKLNAAEHPGGDWDPKVLRRRLDDRDRFLVGRGLWGEYTTGRNMTPMSGAGREG